MGACLSIALKCTREPLERRFDISINAILVLDLGNFLGSFSSYNMNK